MVEGRERARGKLPCSCSVFVFVERAVFVRRVRGKSGIREVLGLDVGLFGFDELFAELKDKCGVRDGPFSVFL